MLSEEQKQQETANKPPDNVNISPTNTNSSDNRLPLPPSINNEEDEETIEFQFENADLENLIKQIEEFYHVTFIPDDIIAPIAPGGKAIKGNKISFKTNRPLNRKEAWNLFITFLDITGLSLVPSADPSIYRIKSIEAARKSAIQVFIGVDSQILPNSDEIIRYVYFIQNSTTEAIVNVIKELIGVTASLIGLPDHKAFILTDKAYNIKTLMNIVKELDKVSMPQSMSVLKLRQADAQQVKELYDSLMQAEDKTTTRFFGARKQPTSIFFPENTRIIAEPRTNALILLGPQDAIKKIEDFIIKHVDVELDQPYSPLHVHQLKFADAATVADIMTNVTQFGQNTQAGKSGGVRGVDQYLKQMSFTPEKTTNRIVIKGDYNDYLAAKEIIEKLDEPQPQVAIEVLILSISLNKSKEFGTQIRSKDPGGPEGFLGKNVEFQTSGLRAQGAPAGIVENPTGTGTKRLLGDLVKLAVGARAGNTLITLGADIFGVWGIFAALETVANVQLISNPFLIATNKTPAKVSLGQTRRVQTATIVGTRETAAFGNEEANLEVEITPQINSDGMIILKLTVTIDDFINPDPSSAEKNTKEIKTQTIVADGEVLALGGLIKNKIDHNLSKVPLLGDIPVLGWLFKNKRKAEDKENLLVLISAHIIEPQKEKDVQVFTQNRISDYYGTLDEMHDVSEKHDPIHRVFFAQKEGTTEQIVDDFLFDRQENKDNKKNRTKKNKNIDNKPLQNKQKQQVSQNKNEQNNEASLQTVQNEINTNNALYEKIKKKKQKRLSLTDFLSDNEGEARA